MSSPSVAVLVLAAGKGTRMRSQRPKVLHPLANQPMIRHLLATAEAVKPERRIVILAPGMTEVAEAVAPAETVVQAEALGTAHAVAQARRPLKGFAGDVLILYGDVPLVTPATLARLLAERRRAPAAAVTVAGMRLAEPGAYGRLKLGADGTLEAIVEAAECTAAERSITLCNSGLMAVDGRELFALIDAVGCANAKGEYYLTDIIAAARARGLVCRAIEASAEELLGVNSRADLALAEAALQRRLRAAHLAAGVTLTAPETVHFSADTQIGRDSVVGPFVVFGPGVTIGEGVEIPAFCHIVGATIGDHAVIGPFARLRPGTELGATVHIGNFVEVKNSQLARGVKANHLSYLGDSSVGAETNVGAGTITCNYDGIEKFRTEIGNNAFIGTNSALVAPLVIGPGAFIAAGSTITEDVPEDALAIGRGRQVTKPGGAAAWRNRRRGPATAKTRRSKA